MTKKANWKLIHWSILFKIIDLLIINNASNNYIDYWDVLLYIEDKLYDVIKNEVFYDWSIIIKT